MSALKHTPLVDLHRKLGGRMVEFAGFEMPVQYTSILAEHKAVRESAGLFDVSHMGQLWFRGGDAVSAVERLVSCPVASLGEGRIRYGVLCNEEGGVVDDVTVYRVGPEEIFLCVNASNIDKDRTWCEKQISGDVELTDRSNDTGLLALQGPRSAAVLARITEFDLGQLKRFRFAPGRVGDVSAWISRTGYTGSDGFEIYLPAEAASATFEALLESEHCSPAGLGARDTLRLEAALPLYGHELDDTTSPLEAGLDRFVKLNTGGFIGAEAIARRARAGHTRKLVGFHMVERGIARAEYPIQHAGADVGRVTSGAHSPTLGKSIGLGYVPTALAELGTALDISIRGRPVKAQVVETPFL